MSRAKVTWTGVDSGYVTVPGRTHVQPFLLSQHDSMWKLSMGGGFSVTQKGEFSKLSSEDLEKEICWAAKA